MSRSDYQESSSLHNLPWPKTWGLKFKDSYDLTYLRVLSNYGYDQQKTAENNFQDKINWDINL